MVLSDFLTLFDNYLFPVGVCIFLLWERSTTMQKFTESIDNLNITLEKYFLTEKK